MAKDIANSIYEEVIKQAERLIADIKAVDVGSASMFYTRITRIKGALEEINTREEIDAVTQDKIKSVMEGLNAGIEKLHLNKAVNIDNVAKKIAIMPKIKVWGYNIPLVTNLVKIYQLRAEISAYNKLDKLANKWKYKAPIVTAINLFRKYKNLVIPKQK